MECRREVPEEKGYFAKGLPEAKGADMQRGYPGIVERLTLSDAQRSAASRSSDCSQFMLWLDEGMKAAG